MARQSSFTSGGIHLLSPTFEVSMKVRNIPSSSLRSVSPSAPSRTTASGKSVVNFGFTALFDTMFLSQSPIYKRRMAVYPEEPSEPAHCSEPSFFLQALHNHLDGAAAIFLLACQEFERVDQIVAASLWCRVRSKIVCISAVHAALHDQNPDRSFPIVLAATRRPPSITLLLPVPHLMCSPSGKQ